MGRRINHRQLEAFQAVVETGTVTAAAERLYVTQPAVTRLIRDLEHFIGFDLFERRAGRLLPTVEAQILHEEVQRSFLGLDRIIQTAQDIHTLNAGSLKIAAMPAVALGFLPRVIGKFNQQHPNVGVSLQIRSSAKVAEWIATQQLDLGIAAVDNILPGIEEELLVEAPFVAAVPDGHRLAGKSRLSPDDFSGESFISQGDEMNARARIDAVFSDAKVKRRMSIDTQLSLAICNMVAAGIGVSLVDPITAWEFSGRGVAARPFSPGIGFRYSLLFPANRPKSILIKPFLAVLKAELQENALVSQYLGSAS